MVTELFITGPALARFGELAGQAAGQGAPVRTVSGEVMTELAQTVTPQGVLAVCRFVDVPLGKLIAAAPQLVVLLAGVRDPGNAGTVLRTADAAGAAGVIFTDASVDPYNSKCVRASAGSLFHLPVVVGRVRCARQPRGCAAPGLRVLAADGKALVRLDDLEAGSKLRQPTAWLFGNEAWGLPADALALADEAVAVPIYGRAESLNLAAAAAVCLYASARAGRDLGSGSRDQSRSSRGPGRASLGESEPAAWGLKGHVCTVEASFMQLIYRSGCIGGCRVVFLTR